MTCKIVESEQERLCRLEAGLCCWHCAHYIRPDEIKLIDGPAHCLCTIDRDLSFYPNIAQPSAGDKETEPDYYCNGFKMEKPPGKQF
jgi:hypothetical protein